MASIAHDIYRNTRQVKGASLKARLKHFAETYAEARTRQAFQTFSEEQLEELGLTREDETGSIRPLRHAA